ncbi:MAG TPA: MFS transporter [Acidimicrobiales bacterium]|jgi:MHS family proline/betaine transporter-like MFS transporter|nr:MFS transporter [Acidimicrobiales bacterium]
MSATHTAAPPLTSADTRLRTSVAVGIGNFMEWFDFAIYGFFAVLIGELFFPAGADPVVAALSSFSVFAIGFLMRPLGAFILGPIGDKHGRRTALVASVVLMGTATFLIGVLPSYAAIGVAAPILLVLLRCAQGLAAGGEWSGSAAYLVESAPANRRGLFGSLISGTAALAFIVGSFVALWINSSLGQEALRSWGWRIPFLLALPMALIGLYIRMRLGDTPVFTALQEKHEVADAPLKQASDKRNLYAILLTFAFSSVSGLGIYYLATYMNNHFTNALGFDRPHALLLSGIGLFLYMLMCPLAGVLSDRVGRRSIQLLGTAGFVLLSIPAFLLFETGNSVLIVAGVALLGVCQALCSVTNVVLLVELFPASTRSSGSALGYNLGLALIAGPGPLIATALVNASGSTLSPSWYLVAVSVVALPILLKWLPETFKRDIHSNEHA